MIEIGKYNTLTVKRFTEPGAYLGDSEGNEVLLPNKYLFPELAVGDEFEVFVYNDSLNRPVATTLAPRLCLNEFAWLTVKQVTKVGAFLDWGVEKDLLVPFREQPVKMQEGEKHLVFLYQDKANGRLVASANVMRFLEKEEILLEPGEEVRLIVWEPTAIGYSVIINNRYKGLLYRNEIFREIQPGDTLKGWVKVVRPDGKIDVSLQEPGYAHVEPTAELILRVLKKSDGFIPLTDSSSPEEIRDLLEMSKKSFKKVVGLLYKQKLIRLETDGIYLN